MMNSSIEASSTGLKVSYLRFVSDSAPGFVVLLLLILIGGERLESRWANHKELMVAVAALSFLLATPLGLTLNAISYFLLGHFQSQINRICFLSRKWPVLDARRTLMVQESSDHFHFTANDWAERNDVYEELVESYRPDLTFRIEHLRGLKRFTRSVSFVSLVCFSYYSLKSGEWADAGAAATVLGWLFCIFFSSRPKRPKLKNDASESAPKTDASPAEAETKAPRFAKIRHELGIVIVLAVAVLIASGKLLGVTRQTIDPIVNEPIRRICFLGVAIVGLLVSGMVDFYQRATIAMYLHIECPPTVTDSLLGISAALSKSAKRLRT